MKDELIKYKDLENKIKEHTSFIYWRGSKEDMLNNWLTPICNYIHDESKFYEISNERDCGWYIKKDETLKRLQDNIPTFEEWKDEFKLILKDLCEYIINYKE